MPHKYIRKSTQQSWDVEAMQHAIEAVRRDKMPYSTAAKQFNVPRNTLKRRVLKKNCDAIEDKKVLGKYRKVFTDKQELELCEHIFDMERQFCGISFNDLRCLAYSFAEINNIPHPFNREKKMAGKDWVASFRKRHPNLTLRKSEVLAEEAPVAKISSRDIGEDNVAGHSSSPVAIDEDVAGVSGGPMTDDKYMAKCIGDPLTEEQVLAGPSSGHLAEEEKVTGPSKLFIKFCK